MDKTIEIDGRLVTFRATAAIPRLYRLRFHRDIMQDMARMREEILKAQKEKKSVPVDILTLFENVAFLMAKHADPSLEANTVEEWLETFSSFSIYTVFPVISELWLENIRTLVEAKKNKADRPVDDYCPVPAAGSTDGLIHVRPGLAHNWNGLGHDDGSRQ